MADRQGVPTPPRMAKQEWLRRDKASVTLSRSDYEYVAQMVAAGRVLLRDGRPVPPQLKAAIDLPPLFGPPIMRVRPT